MAFLIKFIRESLEILSIREEIFLEEIFLFGRYYLFVVIKFPLSYLRSPIEKVYDPIIKKIIEARIQTISNQKSQSEIRNLYG